MDLGLAGRVGVVAGATGEVGEATARTLREAGAEVRELPLDPAAGEPLPNAAADLADVDFLVDLIAAAPGADPRAAFELRVMEPLRAMKALAPVLAGRGGGRIVNVVPPGDPVSGAAALALSRLFADRYAKRGVLVNALCPEPTADAEATAREIAFLCSPRAAGVAGATWTVGAAIAGAAGGID